MNGNQKYSVIEVDTMRNALDEWRYWSQDDNEFPDKVEEVLRTYMLAGASVEEVCAHALEKRDIGRQASALVRANGNVRWARMCAAECASQ